MRLRNFSFQKTHKVVIAIAIVLGLLTIGSPPFFSRDRVKNETSEASAMGTGTQLGAVVGVSIEIYDFSTPDDRAMLVQAIEKGQIQGLVTTLSPR
jgi:hypothetical protein